MIFFSIFSYLLVQCDGGMFGKARTGDVMFPPNVQKAFSIWCQVHKDPLTQLAQKSEGAAAISRRHEDNYRGMVLNMVINYNYCQIFGLSKAIKDIKAKSES